MKFPTLPYELVAEGISRIWKDRPGCQIGVWINDPALGNVTLFSMFGMHPLGHDPGLERGVVMVGPVVRSDDEQYLLEDDEWPEWWDDEDEESE